MNVRHCNIILYPQVLLQYRGHNVKFKYSHYKGCIEDNENVEKESWVIDIHYPKLKPVDECINNCHKGNYKYVGLESRNQCFCGNSYGEVGRVKSSEYCSASCPGDNTDLWKPSGS